MGAPWDGVQDIAYIFPEDDETLYAAPLSVVMNTTGDSPNP